MKRIRIQLPKQRQVNYCNLDVIHDALINAFLKHGADKNLIIGQDAALWNFAALGWRQKNYNSVHTLVVSTSDAELAKIIDAIDPPDIHYTRVLTSESVNFSEGEIKNDPSPIFQGQNSLGVLMLSPIAVSKKVNGKRMWYQKIDEFDLSAAVNYRLSRSVGREVNLSIYPDSLYLRCNPKYDTLVHLKTYPDGKKGFVIGMRIPLLIHGTQEDLELAWYSGIGEKTRNGFGCIDIAERGIGR